MLFCIILSYYVSLTNFGSHDSFVAFIKWIDIFNLTKTIKIFKSRITNSFFSVN